MVAARLPKVEELPQGAKRLVALERSFERLVRARPNLSEALLLKATKSTKGVTRFTSQSREHHRITRSMLSLIDQYVKLHRRTREGREVVLPGSMRGELNKLKIRRALTAPATSIELNKAINRHNERQLTLHEKAEDIMTRHGIGLTLGPSGRRSRA